MRDDEMSFAAHKSRKGEITTMKKFSIREVETLKTTAALYVNGCGGPIIRKPFPLVLL